MNESERLEYEMYKEEFNSLMVEDFDYIESLEAERVEYEFNYGDMV
jgi:hypothetical protein